jgi:cyclase
VEEQNMTTSRIPEREISELPDGYSGPNLSPVGLELTPRPFADGVYALMANVPPKDNNGLVVGRNAALVIDAGITPQVARQIQRLAAELTSTPLRYLVNTTYHGDHTFGNASFPPDVVVVSSRLNKANMDDLRYEKQTRSRNMFGDAALLDEVTTWRPPDLVFDSYAEIDLGGRTVQLHQFGPGNGPGDTVVYVPDTRTAWTGNFLCHAGVAHMLLQGGPEPYLGSLHRMREALPELRTIVPGHGPMGDGHEAIHALIGYLELLHQEVAAAIRAGRSLEETYGACTDPWADGLDPRLVHALAGYEGLGPRAASGMLHVCRDLHRLNVLATYRLYERS